ncbi:hypothetical protein [Halostella salina]|uniref:hypothetical protein n=1 Tax=Halostella salina TaxID=1547897 RepID=UPI000EF828CE|nr:hypothetical protein [Halostella salina]
MGDAGGLDSQQAAGAQAETETDAENGSGTAVERLTPTSGNVTVAPGSEMLFEAAATDYGGDYVLAEWTVDGELAASVAGFGSEYGREGEVFLQQSFEETGPHTVTATVVDANGDRVGTVEWAVTVAPNGNTAPEITGSPAAGNDSLRSSEGSGGALSATGTANLSVDVADPDGDLHRVVWLLGVADARLGTSSVNGSTDTARVSVDDVCDSCPVFVWVVDESGAVTERTVGGPPADDGTNETATH